MTPSRPIDIYVRVSRVGKREDLQSLDDQEHDARRFAEAHDLRVGKVLKDENRSGGNVERAGLQQILRRVEGGESGGVVISYLSRFSRDTVQGLTLIDRITAAGGVVYAPNLPDYTSPDGRMLTTIQLAIDSGYRERKGAEFERAKEAAIARGVAVNTRPAVGYKKVGSKKGKDRRLEPDPTTAPIVRQVFEQRAEGEGPAELGRFLQASEVRTSQGSRTWTKQAVYNLLANRIYLGELSYGRDRRYVNPTSHEPIVDLATWQAAQHPNGRKLTPPRSEASTSLLSGLLRCAACRYCMQATTTSRGKRIYRCTRTHSGGVCPAPARIAADQIEAVALDAYWKLGRDYEAEGSERASDDDLSTLEEAAERSERSLLQWTSPEVQEAIGDLGEYASGLLTRRAARDHDAASLGRARAAHRSTASLPSFSTIEREWDDMSTSEQREFLGARIDCLALAREPARLVVFPEGSGPTDLPRRGFKSDPVLAPFPDAPSGVRVLAL